MEARRAVTEYRPNTPQIDLKKSAEVLKRNRERLTSLITPTSRTGRARFELAKRFSFLRNVFEVSPMETIRAEMRGVLLDLTNNMPALVESGEKRINIHRELLGFYTEAIKDPENWSLTERLKERLQAEADEDRQLKLDEQTEDIVAQIIKTDDPGEKTTEQQEIFESAKQRLDLTEPIVRVTEASIRATYKLRAMMMRQYSIVLDLSPDLDLIHRNSGALIDGVMSGRCSQEVIIKILEQAIGAVDLSLKAVDLGNRLDQANDIPRLLSISQEAKALLGGIKNGDFARS